MTQLATPAQLRAVLRTDFLSFLRKCFQILNPGQTFHDNWHIEAILSELEACFAGQRTRLIVNVPPRSLKSQIISVAYCAWVLGHDPTKRIICVSYSEALSVKLAREFRNIVGSSWYQELFPQMRAARDTDAEFETTEGGFRLATSVGGTITGRGAEIIIIDDPLKPEEAISRVAREHVNNFYGQTLFTRLNDKQRGVIILVMQRLHHEDLAGFLLSQGGWTHLNFPALATRDESIPIGGGRVHDRRIGDVLQPAREPRHVLEDIKRVLGSMAFQAQYQQAPIPEAGNLIKLEWFKYYDSPPPRQPGDKIVQSWDTAMKDKEHNSYSVCTTWLVRSETYYLLDLVRRHCKYPELLGLIAEQHRKYRPDTVLIEEKAFGAALIPDIKNRHSIHAIAIIPKGDKLTRLSTASPKIEAGQVVLPKHAPWLGEFLDELLNFPQTRFDDQVDSVSQFLNWQRNALDYRFEYEFM